MKKILQLLFTCVAFMQVNSLQATTCAGATPVALGANTLVCGLTDDINNISGCGSTSYQGGEESLMTFTPAMTGDMTLDYSGVTYTGIFVWDDCPTAGGVCVGTPVTGSSSSKTMTVSVTAGTTYFIMVDTWPTPNSPCPGTLTISVAPPAVPPANDDIAGAIPLTLGVGACSTPVIGTNVAATNSGVSHTCASYSGGDVWYYVVVPTAGTFSVEGTNVDFTDGGMQAYAGPSTALTSINCDDDDSPAGAMPGIYPADGLSGLTPGDTVWIAIWEYGNNAFGDFEICAWGPPTCPEPTNFSSTNITSTGVDLLWTTGGATDWIVEYGTTGFTPGMGTTVLVSTNDSLNLTGLTAETSYDWYVRDYCAAGDSSLWSGVNTFYTGYCQPAPSSVDANGLENVTMGTINNSTGTETNNYGDYTAMVTDAAQTTNLDITVTIGYGYGVWAWIDWNNDLDFEDVGEFVFLGETSSGVPMTSFITIPATASLGNHRIRIGGSDFSHSSTSSHDPCYTGSYGTFEDYTLNVVAPPPCITPTIDSVANLSDVSVELHWTTGGATDWIVEYGVSGFTQGTGTIMSVSTNDSLVLTGLMSATSYDWYVRDYCGGTDSSAWSPVSSFLTLCPAVFTAPYCEGFEGNVCGGNDINDQFDWTINSGGTTSGSTGPSAAHGGSLYIYTETSGTSNGDTAILYSPFVDLTALTTPTIDFYYHMYGAGMNPDGTLSIDVTNDGGVTWTNIFSEMGDQGNQWNNGYVEMPSFAGDTVAFRFTGIVSSTGTTYQNDFAIDDFCVIEALPCPGMPSNLNAENVTFTTADLTFMNMMNATNWVIEWDSAGFTQGTGNVVPLMDTFANVTGLTANSYYEFYVRDYCGGTDSSTWAGPFQFYTGYCIPAPTSTDANGIVNVTMGSINNTSGALNNDYADYTSMVADAGQGVNFDISVTVEYGYGIWAWVDWNNDLDFDDAGEFFFLGETTNGVPLNSSILIPATATLGNHVIRIGGSDFNHGSSSSHDPCYAGSWGSFEDYTLNVIACNIPVTTLPTSFCDGDSIVLSNGVSVLTAGMYNDTLTAITGCDSVLTYDVTVLMPTTSMQDETICQGETLTLAGGTMVTTAGTYEEVFVNAVGCDSTVTTNVTVNVATASSVDVHLCDGATYTLPLSGTVVSTANAYVETTSNAMGCDSVVTYNVTTGMSSVDTMNLSFCSGGGVMLPDGTGVTTPGSYDVTTTNATGCDLVTTYVVTENTTPMTSISETICDNETYMFDGQALNTAGVYNMVVTGGAVNGCDSLVELTLTVNATSGSMMSETICEGDSYMFDGQSLTMSGTYADTLMNAAGCDSVVTLMLTVNATSSSMMSASICDGDSYMFDGQSLTTAGTYTQTLMNAAGCDSVVTLTLTVNTAADETMDVAICNGSEYVFGTQTLTEAGVYTEMFTNAAGCDYEVTLTLTVNSNISTSEDVLLCGDQLSYTLANGTVVTEAGIYTAKETTAEGCEKLITYNVSTCVGIFDLDNNVAMTIYPNPAKDVLNVLFAEKLTDVNSVTVVNVLGQEIYSVNNIDETSLTINTTSLTSGIYYIHVTSDNKVSVKSFTVAK